MTGRSTPLTIKNGGSTPLAALPHLDYDSFAALLLAEAADRGRVAAYFADPAPDAPGRLDLYAVVARDHRGELALLRARIGTEIASLTPRWPQLHLFEREIAEQFGVTFTGHPWFKPIRFHASYAGAGDAWGRDQTAHPLVGDMPYYQVNGEEVHEVAVGPVHAGVIEPGHFRFQCHGERVLHLEISLGYQHRGVEPLLAGGPHPQTPLQLETVAGDTTIGHATAHALLVEALTGAAAPPRALAIRALALELERLANHVGDIGALAGDVAFLPTASFCGRLRGEYLNMTAALCGSRFGRGLARPGGVLFDVEPELGQRLLAALEPVKRDTLGAIRLFAESPSVLARLEGTGRVPREQAESLGLVGVAGRAAGLRRDVRQHHPITVDDQPFTDICVEQSGDVFARARVRQREVVVSLGLVRRLLGDLPAGPLSRPLPPPAADTLAVAMVEGWRGEIVHVARTDAEGRIGRYKIVDPSFHNWSGLAMALRGEQISDFPLCNKSFNLSYCGFDL